MDEVFSLSAQVEALRRKIDNFNASNMYVQNIICDYCGGEHAYSDCPIDNYVIHLLNKLILLVILQATK